MLPNFLIIGPGRSGTTSLYHWLNEHPEIFMSTVKELCFFSLGEHRHVNTREDYERYFAGVTTEKMWGEACPSYFWSETAADAIRNAIPDVKLIATLRNPADRAYSAYLLVDKSGATPEEAIRPGYHAYEVGFYARHIRRYFSLFPRENIHFVLFEDLTRRSDDTLRGIFRFLGVDHAVKVSTTAHNVSREVARPRLKRLLDRAVRLAYPLVPSSLKGRRTAKELQRLVVKKSPPIPTELRTRLLEAYRADILETSSLIGRDLSMWLQ
jgi:hypothetical protein